MRAAVVSFSLLLLPVRAMAGPAMPPPGQVIAQLRAELNGDSFEELVVLARNGRGGVDLHILTAKPGVPALYAKDFLAAGGDVPELSLVGSETLAISQRQTTTQGSRALEFLVAWDWERGGYAVVGAGVEATEAGADVPYFRCRTDLLVGAMRRIVGDKLRGQEISLPPRQLPQETPLSALAPCQEQTRKTVVLRAP